MQNNAPVIHSRLTGPWEPEGRKPDGDVPGIGPHGNGQAERWSPGGRGSNLEPPIRGIRGWRDEERSNIPPVRRDGAVIPRCSVS